jgi:methylated-DNA-protein-cysteine methyltransferase-like protein
MPTEFTEDVIRVISSIPEGKVLSYGMIAAIAGRPRGARQVTRILSSSSRKYNLPWHRVVNAQGKISVKEPHFYEEQKQLLMSEGVEFSKGDRINLDRFCWSVESIKDI